MGAPTVTVFRAFFKKQKTNKDKMKQMTKKKSFQIYKLLKTVNQKREKKLYHSIFQDEPNLEMFH